jgi:hypothetical protein
MVLTEACLLISAALLFGVGSSGVTLIGIPCLVLITAVPYGLVAVCSVVFFDRSPISSWLLFLGMILVALASLFFRFAEFNLAHAVTQGAMNCAPPARLVILFIDYFGTAVIMLLAAPEPLVRAIILMVTRSGTK